MTNNEIIFLNWNAGEYDDDDDDEKQEICEYCKTRSALAENYGIMCGHAECLKKFDLEMSEKQAREKQAREKQAREKQEIKAKNAKLKKERKVKRNANKYYRLFKFTLKIAAAIVFLYWLYSGILNVL